MQTKQHDRAKPTAALVTEAQLRAVVAGIRGLGQAGVPVRALGPRRSAAGLWSRYSLAREVGPDPGSEPERFVERLARSAAAPGAVVYPGSEAAIAATLNGWKRLAGAGLLLPYPEPGPVRVVRDKRRLPELAEAGGLDGMQQQVEATAGELTASPPAAPFVVKPAVPPGALAGARLIHSAEELTATFRSRRVPADERLLVQERLAGRLVSLELVIGRDGEAVARFQQAASETWPTAAGSISSAVSVPVDEQLCRRAVEMLSAAGYWGLAQLDLMQAGDGFTLLDVNPRFYSCLPLALACGVNLPAAWHAVASGATPPAIPDSYPAGVGFRWVEGDLRAALKGQPGRLRRRHAERSIGSTWSSKDPLPGALLGLGALTLDLRRRAGRG